MSRISATALFIFNDSSHEMEERLAWISKSILSKLVKSVDMLAVLVVKVVHMVNDISGWHGPHSDMNRLLE